MTSPSSIVQKIIPKQHIIELFYLKKFFISGMKPSSTVIIIFLEIIALLNSKLILIE